MISPVEGIRKRPAMYVGGTDQIGLHHMLFALVDNTIDHFAMGRATFGRLTLQDDGSATWEDDGPGLDAAPIPEFDNRSLAEVVFTEFDAGGRLARGAPYPSGTTWMWDIGTVVLNALSQSLEVTIRRSGREWKLFFAGGARQGPLIDVGNSAQSGIHIRFKPDGQIFKNIRFDSAAIARRLQELAFLNGGLRIDLSEERTAGAQSYCYPDGIEALVTELNRPHFPLYEGLVHVSSAETDGIAVDFCLQHNTGFKSVTRWFVNNEEVLSGTHVRGFCRGLRRAIGRYGREHGILSGRFLRTPDTCEGLAAVVSVRLRDPWFESPTRSKLGNPQVEEAVRSAVESGLADFFRAHPAFAEQIVSKAATAASARWSG